MSSLFEKVPRGLFPRAKLSFAIHTLLLLEDGFYLNGVLGEGSGLRRSDHVGL